MDPPKSRPQNSVSFLQPRPILSVPVHNETLLPSITQDRVASSIASGSDKSAHNLFAHHSSYVHFKDCPSNCHIIFSRIFWINSTIISSLFFLLPFPSKLLFLLRINCCSKYYKTSQECWYCLGHEFIISNVANIPNEIDTICWSI